EFDEVWFPGGRRNEQRRHEPRRRDAGDGEGQAQGRRPDRQRGPSKRRPENERGEAALMPAAARGRPAEGRNKRPDKAERPERPERQRPVREERKPVFDPDSPFAAL